jgi:hypothetical protein
MQLPFTADTEKGLRRICEVLLRPFIDTGNPATSEVKLLSKGGSHKYIEGNSVIDRLNEAFTPLGWTWVCPPEWVVWQPAAEGLTSRQIAVYGELRIMTPWGEMRKGAYGARTVMAQADGTKMEFGDDLKSAGTDALKKAATMLGIFNYIYRKSALPLIDEVKPLAEELNRLRVERKWNKDQFLTFCSGVTRKTVLGAGDLSYVQAEACLALLKMAPEGYVPQQAPAA